MGWIEVRHATRRLGAPIFVEVIDPASGYSFRSVYEHTEAAAKAMTVHGSTAGGSTKVLYSDTLFVDIDTGMTDVHEFDRALRSLGVGYTQWSTGRRGGHFHVNLVPMEGTNVPLSQKEWVRVVSRESADLSIYTPTGQFRLAGAAHEKAPGKRKVLIKTVIGVPLTIPEVLPKTIPTTADTTVTEWKWITNLTQARSAGGRSSHLYIICCNGVALNKEDRVIAEEAIKWNILYNTPPLDQRYIERKIANNIEQLRR